MQNSIQECQFSGECAFFNDRISKMPVEASFLKQLYCQKLSYKCQRRKYAHEFSVSDPTNEIPPLVVYAEKKPSREINTIREA